MGSQKYPYEITIALDNNDDILGWDRVCIGAIELFGMPGGRYITDIGTESMTWLFCDPKDAVLFKLKFSEHTL